jgi:hypothetical protein
MNKQTFQGQDDIKTGCDLERGHQSQSVKGKAAASRTWRARTRQWNSIRIPWCPTWWSQLPDKFARARGGYHVTPHG